ncbi:MAG: helix-turn-helix transcriptional regulator [Proteobacteria bacterium]|nr:helix-turn-helix transcriptional regulator [Pseudomonadota bacterium]
MATPLRELRESKGLSQDDLVKLAGVAKGTIVGLELHRQKPRPSTRRKLARARDEEFTVPFDAVAAFPRDTGLAVYHQQASPPMGAGGQPALRVGGGAAGHCRRTYRQHQPEGGQPVQLAFPGCTRAHQSSMSVVTQPLM